LSLASKNHSPKISVVCGFALLGESIADSMELRELNLHLTHSLQIIFDADWTFALNVPIDASKTSIIITDNPCPEYWEDLWDRKPTLLIAGKNIGAIDLFNYAIKADTAFTKVKRMKETPHYEVKLTQAQRKIFRLAVQPEGFSIAEMAKLNGNCKEQTIRNHLQEIYNRLDIKNRTQLVLYYRHGDKGREF
jgi:DNA-binding CsgD family transcriptional regulator